MRRVAVFMCVCVCVPVCCLSLLLPLLPLHSSSDVSSSSSTIWTLVATVEITSLFSSCPQWGFHDKMMACFFTFIWHCIVYRDKALPSQPVWPLVCCCAGKFCCGPLLWRTHCLHTAGPHLLTSVHPEKQEVMVQYNIRCWYSIQYVFVCIFLLLVWWAAELCTPVSRSSSTER